MWVWWPIEITAVLCACYHGNAGFSISISLPLTPPPFSLPLHTIARSHDCWRQAGESGIQSVRGSDQFVLLAHLLFRRGDAACLSLGVSAVIVSRSIFSSPLLLSLSVPPSPALFFSSVLLYPCLLRRLLQLLLPQTSRGIEAGNGLLNGWFFSCKLR